MTVPLRSAGEFIPPWSPGELAESARAWLSIAQLAAPPLSLPTPDFHSFSGANRDAYDTAKDTLASLLAEATSAAEGVGKLLERHSGVVEFGLGNARSAQRSLDKIRTLLASATDPVTKSALVIAETYYRFQLHSWLHFLDSADGAAGDFLGILAEGLEALSSLTRGPAILGGLGGLGDLSGLRGLGDLAGLGGLGDFRGEKDKDLYGTSLGNEPHAIARHSGELSAQLLSDGHPAKQIDTLLRTELDRELELLPPDSHRALYLKGVKDGLASHPDSLVLYLDQDGVAIALGDPDTAPAIATLVPGVGSSNPGSIAGQLAWASHIKTDSTPGSSVVAWSAYSAPGDLVKGASSTTAEQAVPKLKQFQSDLRKRSSPGSNLTVIGYSYGSVVVGHSARQPETTAHQQAHGSPQSETEHSTQHSPPNNSQHGLPTDSQGGSRKEPQQGRLLEADSLVFVGSPGTGSQHASDLAATALDGHTEIYVGRNPGDPIALTTGPHSGVHGADPTHPSWGADWWIDNTSIRPVPDASATQKGDYAAWLTRVWNGQSFSDAHHYEGYSSTLGEIVSGSPTTQLR